jgi:hypothetical protein
MKAKAEERGIIEQGFKRVSDGWHLFEVKEGIGHLQKKVDGDLVDVKDKNGNLAWKFPFMVADDNDPDFEIEHDAIVYANDYGEEMVMKFLAATGRQEAFIKAFPGDVSVFQDEVMNKIKASKNQLTGQRLHMLIVRTPNKKDPDNPYINIGGYGRATDTLAELNKLVPAKKEVAGKGKEKEKSASAVDDDVF